MAKHIEGVVSKPDLLDVAQKKRLVKVEQRIDSNKAQLDLWQTARGAEEDNDMKKILPLTTGVVEAIQDRGDYLKGKRNKIVAEINEEHSGVTSQATASSLADSEDVINDEYELSEQGVKKDKRKYPITLQHSGGFVVRFTSRNSGIVVVGDRQYKKGFKSDKWISSQDKFMWTEVEEGLSKQQAETSEQAGGSETYKQSQELNKKLKKLSGNNNNDMVVQIRRVQDGEDESLQVVVKTMELKKPYRQEVTYEDMSAMIKANKKNDVSVLAGIIMEQNSSTQSEEDTDDCENSTQAKKDETVTVNFKNFKPSKEQLKFIATFTRENFVEVLKSDAYTDAFPNGEYDAYTDFKKFIIDISVISGDTSTQADDMSLDDALNINK